MKEAEDLKLYREGIERLSKRLASNIGLPELEPSDDKISGILNVQLSEQATARVRKLTLDISADDVGTERRVIPKA